MNNRTIPAPETFLRHIEGGGCLAALKHVKFVFHFHKVGQGNVCYFDPSPKSL